MKKMLVRLLLLLLLIFLFVASFAFTFLYGSSWLPNSAHTLALFPSIFLTFITCIFIYSSKNESRRWRIADWTLGSVIILALASISLSLLGFFSSAPNRIAESDNGSGYIQSSEALIYYHQSESKRNSPAVLVLHGGPGSGSYTMRAELCDSLDTDFSMIYFDQRGTGRSSWAISFTLDDYLNDMENLRKSLNINSWYLLSASWGSVLANEYAVRFPERVKGIINWGGLICSQLETKEMIRHIIADYEIKKETEEIAFWNELLNQETPYNRFQTLRTVNRINQNGLKSIQDEQTGIQSILALRKRAMRDWGYKRNELGANLWVTLATFMQVRLEKYDFRPKLKEIKQPYLFLAGRYDPQMNMEELQQYKELITNASFEIVENSGHLFDNPDELIIQIKTFIHSHE